MVHVVSYPSGSQRLKKKDTNRRYLPEHGSRRRSAIEVIIPTFLPCEAILLFDRLASVVGSCPSSFGAMQPFECQIYPLAMAPLVGIRVNCFFKPVQTCPWVVYIALLKWRVSGNFRFITPTVENVPGTVSIGDKFALARYVLGGRGNAFWSPT